MNAIFNPHYFLKPDNGKALILTRDPYRAKNNEKLESVIHPVHAMILAFFNGDDVEACISRASDFLKVEKVKVELYPSCPHAPEVYNNVYL